MSIVFYISGHGLGHAVRQIEVIRALLRRQRDARIIVRSSAQPWLLRRDLPAGIATHHVEVDTGVVQNESVDLDEAATVREAMRFYAEFDRRVDDEARVLRDVRAAVVVGDIPPLAFAAAARAGVPSVAIGNFTWDWIYDAIPGFAAEAPGVVSTIRDAYGHATAALRLPLHGGFDAMSPVITRDMPFIARRIERDQRTVRETLGVGDDRPVVLASFGGYGVDLPIDRLRAAERFTFITPPREPEGVTYEEIVAASDVVVSKPGYGIVTDCIVGNTALLYTSRGRFREYDVFVEQMPKYLRCGFISQEDLRAGRWEDAIGRLLAQTPPSERPRVDGAEIAANAMAALLK